MPPTAASTGVATRRRSRSSPMSNSRRISSPTTKKKNAINPSLIQWRRSSDSSASPNCSDTSVCQNDS